MSDRDEFYRQFSRSYDKLHQSEMQDDLVERVAHVFWDTPGKPDDRLRAAIGVALEEAAKVAEECAPLSQDTWSTELAERCDMVAAAIRALIPQEPA